MTNIRRHAGTPIKGTPYAYGAGYRGLTSELDKTVERAAQLLAGAFRRDIEIRFNTDRHSGGAWLIDNKNNASVGLTAGLQPIRPAGLTDEEWYALDAEEPRTIQVATFVRQDRLRDPTVANTGNPATRYASYEHATLEDGLAHLLANVKKVLL